MSEPLISVVIPAYNEEHSIGFLLQRTHDVLRKEGLPYEIIVVNDGSTDKTAEIAKEYNVLLVNNEKNLGKGGSLRTGFKHAKGKLIITMDADGSHQPEDLPYLISPILKGDADAVFGSRFVNGKGKDTTSKLHLFGNAILNFVILLLTGKQISDSQSGFRAFTRDILKKITLTSSRYEIESEMLIKILDRKFRFIEIPINCKKRMSGSTKINSFSDGFKILKAILKAKFCS